MRVGISGWPVACHLVRTVALIVVAILTPAAAAAQRVHLEARVAGNIVSLSRDVLPATSEGSYDALAGVLQWRVARPGLAWTELDLRAGSFRVPVRAVVARLDPAQYRLQLELVTAPNRMSGAWTVDAAPASAALAVNAGQFLETGPWGWVVLEGREHREPGRGPLAVGIAVDTAGRVHWLTDERLARGGSDIPFMYAFQSYPLLLLDGKVPALARDRGAVSHEHRDARLVLAELADGSLLLVLTRYGALGGAAQKVPIGLTLPETVLLVSALGARHAVMLDGGVSAQLLLRGEDGSAQRWRGMRRVPLALVAIPRD
jgi:hypothetical protein